MSQFTSKIYDELQRSNKKMESLKWMKVEIELSKTLGDTDRLKELAAKMRKVNEV